MEQFLRSRACALIAASLACCGAPTATSDGVTSTTDVVLSQPREDELGPGALVLPQTGKRAWLAPGEVFFADHQHTINSFDDVPIALFAPQSERLAWDVLGTGEILVNGEIVGFDISDLTEVELAELRNNHHHGLQVLVHRYVPTLSAALVQAFTDLAAPGVALTLVFDEAIDLAPLAPLARSISGLSLRGRTMSLSTLAPFESLHALSLQGAASRSLEISDAAPWPVLPALRTLHLARATPLGPDALRHLATTMDVRSLHVDALRSPRESVELVGTMGSLRELSFGLTPLEDASMEPLGSLSELRVLRISTSRGHAVLPSLTKLVVLDINARGIGDRHMGAIAQIPGIRELSLEAPTISADAFQSLAALADLQSISLPGGEVNDMHAAVLGRLSKLEHVDLHATNITNVTLEELSLVPLRHLNVSMTRVDDDGLSRMRGMDHLEALDISATGATDAGLFYLAELSQLKKLRIISRDVSDAGLAELGKLQNLESLEVIGGNVSGHFLEKLTGLTKLSSLVLAQGPADDEGLKHLASFGQLRYLDLLMTNAGDGGAPYLKALTKLETLLLTSTKTGDNAIGSIAALKSLHTVHLGETAVTDAGASGLAQLDTLRWLSLESTAMTDAGLTSLATLKRLRTLHLNGTKIQGGSLSQLEPLQNLRLVGLPPQISPEDEQGFRFMHPGCRVVRGF